MVATITTAELAKQIKDVHVAIVDVRPMAAYIGWRLDGEPRGGHIRGAIAFPNSWLPAAAPARLKSFLESNGAAPDKTIVVYGYGPSDAGRLIAALENLEYRNLRIYAEGFHAWAQDSDRPIDRLPRYERLVRPEWLQQLITTGAADHFGGGRYAIFHVDFDGPRTYSIAHVPGAFHLDTKMLESEDSANRRSAEELDATLTSLGIAHDTTVILYGRDSAAQTIPAGPGQLAAMRAAAILMYAGVEDVRLLDGGFDAWVAAGYDVETETNQPTPVAEFGVAIPAHPEYFIDLDEAKELLADSNGALVSIRTWEEFLGNVSGYDYIGPRGRIAGAVWGNCGTDANHMQHYYRSPDNTMRAYHEIESHWNEVGVTPDKRVAFYCGTGWRASEAFFYAYLMGMPRVSVYDGGWYEWSSHPSNPVDVGEPA